MQCLRCIPKSLQKRNIIMRTVSDYDVSTYKTFTDHISTNSKLFFDLTPPTYDGIDSYITLKNVQLWHVYHAQIWVEYGDLSIF